MTTPPNWIWDADWFSDQKPALVNGCYYAWRGYWDPTIEEGAEFGKYFFNWGYAGPFASKAECEEWIGSHDAAESLGRCRPAACLGGSFAESATCQPMQDLHRGVRPWMPLKRSPAF